MRRYNRSPRFPGGFNVCCHIHHVAAGRNCRAGGDRLGLAPLPGVAQPAARDRDRADIAVVRTKDQRARAELGDVDRTVTDARRAQYLEVRGTVHRKLLTRLNLEKLATSERKSVEGEIRTLVSSPLKLLT